MGVLAAFEVLDVGTLGGWLNAGHLVFSLADRLDCFLSLANIPLRNLKVISGEFEIVILKAGFSVRDVLEECVEYFPCLTQLFNFSFI